MVKAIRGLVTIVWALFALPGQAAVTSMPVQGYPQVKVNIDLNPLVRVDRAGGLRFHWYDDSGNHSTVSLTLLTEVGFRAHVAQRVEVIRGDADGEYPHEYYIEDTGYWRVGKQLLPFGLQELEREYARAARVDTRFAIGALPLRVAWCEGDIGSPRGYVARLGERLGVSIASGRHFGVSASAFQEVRDPEDSPGRGKGYRELYGADLTYGFGPVMLEAEWVRTRRGHTREDADNDIGFLRMTYGYEFPQHVSLSFARDFNARRNAYRLRYTIRLDQYTKTYFQVRWKGGTISYIGVGLHAGL